jgi:hypothetical protein
MSDDNAAYNRNVSKRLAQEHAELDDPIISRQLQLDHFWQRRLDARAAARRRALGDQPGGCDPSSGAYDPFARFTSVTAMGFSQYLARRGGKRHRRYRRN